MATGFPRDKMYGVWWAGAEPDVGRRRRRQGLQRRWRCSTAPSRAEGHKDMLKLVHDKGQGTGPKEEVGTVLYTRGMISAMLGVEGVRRAQVRYGVKPLTGEQVRWGLENLAIDPSGIEALGLDRRDAADRHELPRS